MKILQVPELSKWNKQKLKSQNEKKMKEKKRIRQPSVGGRQQMEERSKFSGDGCIPARNRQRLQIFLPPHFQHLLSVPTSSFGSSRRLLDGLSASC